MSPKKEEPKKLDYEYYELVIIVNALRNKEYLSAIIDHVDLEYFKDANNREFIKNIFRFFVERGECPALEELKSRLSTTEDKNSYKNVITKILTQKLLNVEFNKEELFANTEKFLKDRGLYKTIDTAAEQHTLGVIDLDETLKSIEKIYAISLQESLGHWYFEDVEKHITDLTTTYHPIPTGWNSLDSRLEGGVFPKTLTSFIGQVNVGKSIVLGNLAANMTLKGKNVLLISLEMSEFMYSKRISSQISQIPHSNLKLYHEELKNSIQEVGAKLDSKLVVKEFPPKAVTVRQIDAYINKLRHNGFKPDVVIIDYLNLINPSTKGLNSYESVKEIAEQLRALAFKYNIPFISASQLNRCLDVNVLIETEDRGYIALKDVKIGDRIRSSNEGNLNWVDVKHIYPTMKNKTFRIKTKSGKSIICSGQHVFPTENGLRSIYSGLSEKDKFFVKM